MPEIDHRVILGGEKSSFKVQELCLRIKREKEFKNRDRMLSKPLVRVVPITLKERMIYLVQYEKIPGFCFHCGMMGHEVTECGDGVHSRDKCEWGDWLRVPFALAVSGRDEMRGGRGCGRGRGRGQGGGRGEWTEEESEDMEISHEDEEELEIGEAKKRDATEVEGRGRVAQQVNLLENTPHLDIDTSPLKEQEKKRARRTGGEDGTSSTINRSALSFEESDRAQ
jgi:hypothetical protein